MKDKYTHAVRALTLVEAAVKLLHDAQIEAISAVGHLNDYTREIGDIMRMAEGVRPWIERLIERTAQDPAVPRTATKEKK